MWLKHKVKSDISLEDLAKKFKNTELDVLLKHPGNKVAAQCYKQGKPIPKGTTVFLLDPKVKIYIVPMPGGKKQVMSEKEYKASVAKANKDMDFAAKQYRSTYDTMVYRHDLQNEALNEFYFTSLLTASWVGEKGREPVKQKKAAQKAVKALESTVKSRDYANFGKKLQAAIKALNTYGQGIDDYIEQHTGSAGNWATGLTYVRDASLVTFGALAMTVAAPATAAGTLGYGALVGGGTAAMSSGGNELGRVIAGDDVTFKGSAGKIAKDIANGALLGAAGGAIARYVGAGVIKVFAQRLSQSGVVQGLIARAAGSRFFPELGKRVYQAELHALMNALQKEAGDKVAVGMITITPQVLDRMCVNVSLKVITRLGAGSLKKYLTKSFDADIVGWCLKYIQTNATKIKGNANDGQVAEQMTDALLKDKLAEKAMSGVLKDNKSKIEEELRKELRKELDRQAKKALKKAK